MTEYPSQSEVVEKVLQARENWGKQLAVAGGITALMAIDWWYLGRLSQVMISFINPGFNTGGPLSLPAWESRPWWIWSVLIVLIYGGLWAMAALNSLLVTKWYLRLAPIIIAPLPWLISSGAGNLSWVVLMGMLGHGLMSWEIKRSLDIYKKFSLSKLLLPTASIWFMVLSIMVAIPMFAYLNANRTIVGIWVEERMIKPQVNLMVDQSENQLIRQMQEGLSGQGLENFDNQFNAMFKPEIATKLEKMWSQDSSNQTLDSQTEVEINRQIIEQLSNGDNMLPQFDKEEIKKQVTTQVKDTLAPVLKYAHIILPILIFASLWQATSFFKGIIWLVPWIGFEITKALKIVRIDVKNEPVEFLKV